MEGLWNVFCRRSIDLQSAACMTVLTSDKCIDIAHADNGRCFVMQQLWKYVDESQMLLHHLLVHYSPIAVMYLQEKVERLSGLAAGQLLWGRQVHGLQPGLLKHRIDYQHDR